MLHKSLHPEFAQPGKKPLCAVEIDRFNKFGRYVRNAFVPNVFAVDVIHGRLTPNNTPFIKSGLAQFDDSGFYTYVEPFPVVSELTIIAKVRRNATNELQGIYSDKTNSNWSGTNGVSLSLRNDTQRMHFKISTSEAKGSSWSTLDNTTDFFTIAASWKTPGVLKLFSQGEECPVYGTQDSLTSYSKSTEEVCVGAYFSRTSTYAFDGDIEYAYFLDRELSLDEIRELGKDPYQVLRPAAPFGSHFIAAVGGSGNPWYAYAQM